MVTPALVWPGFEPTAGEPSKAVRKRLAHAARRKIAARGSFRLAAAALDIEPPPQAALARIGEGRKPDSRSWFLAEPITLVPDRDTLVMLPLGAASLERDEETALFAAARTHFGDRLTLEQGAGGRWYAALENVRDATSVPPDEVAGRPLDIASLASGPDAAGLRAFLTELQMLWYEHPVNRARREAGLPEANALWLWGGGRLPARPPPLAPTVLRANAPELAGLAHWLGLDSRPAGEPQLAATDSAPVVVVAESEPLGEAWLRAFAAGRGEFLIHADHAEWRVPARRGWLPFRG